MHYKQYCTVTKTFFKGCTHAKHVDQEPCVSEKHATGMFTSIEILRMLKG